MEGDFQVGAWLVQPKLNSIWGNGKTAHVEPKVMHVLVCLAEHAGEVIDKERLIHAVWPDTFVTDDVLTRAIAELRKAFHDDIHNPRVIQTIPKGGYRLIALVEWIDRAVGAGLVPAPIGRPQGAPLRRWWIIVGSGGLLAILAGLLALNVAGVRDRILRAVGAVHEPPLRIQSIAVLPLENLSHDPEQEYFADGMTEALITNLGKIRALRVISRTTAMHYKGTKKTLPEIARDLNVDAVVEGSVLRFGNRLRVTANLLDGLTDRHLWANTYESEIRDVLVLQGEVARAIAEEVRIKVTPDEHVRLTSTRAANPDAYQALLKGRYYVNHLQLDKGVELLRRAVDIDPNYAPSYSSLAQAHWELGFGGVVPPADGFSEARAAATKALELDETLGEAHAVLGLVKLHFEWDFAGADAEFRQAAELSPNSAIVQFRYGNYLIAMGRFDEGIAATKRGAELDPLNSVAVQSVGVVLFEARRYDEGIAYLRKQLEIDPSLTLGHYQLAHGLAAKGMYAEALVEADEGKCGAGCGWVYAVSGRHAEAQKSIRELEELWRRRHIAAMEIAEVYAGLGEKDLAIRWLQKAYEARDPVLPLLKVEPLLDPLRSDPRFEALLRRMNFPP